jgi:hypothetical protein
LLKKLYDCYWSPGFGYSDFGMLKI